MQAVVHIVVHATTFPAVIVSLWFLTTIHKAYWKVTVAIEMVMATTVEFVRATETLALIVFNTIPTVVCWTDSTVQGALHGGMRRVAFVFRIALYAWYGTLGSAMVGVIFTGASFLASFARMPGVADDATMRTVGISVAKLAAVGTSLKVRRRIVKDFIL